MKTTNPIPTDAHGIRVVVDPALTARDVLGCEPGPLYFLPAGVRAVFTRFEVVESTRPLTPRQPPSRG